MYCVIMLNNLKIFSNENFQNNSFLFENNSSIFKEVLEKFHDYMVQYTKVVNTYLLIFRKIIT